MRPGGFCGSRSRRLLAAPLTPLLLGFQERYPAVSLEVFTETRFVELTADPCAALPPPARFAAPMRR
jgi:hypothetical protein